MCERRVRGARAECEVPSCYRAAMRRGSIVGVVVVACATLLHAADADWAYWRGPKADGMAIGTAPLRWSDTADIRWKVPCRGKARRRRSCGVTASSSPRRCRRTTGNPRRGLVEHRFVVLCYDRRTGAPLWERVARVATPHEPHHSIYGSFASNAPVTDGKHVYAFFGSRGLYAYTVDGRPIWQKDFGASTCSWTSARGPGPGSKAIRCSSSSTTRAIRSWSRSTPRPVARSGARLVPGNTNWSGPYVTTVNGRKQVIVSASREVVGYDLGQRPRIWWTRGLGQNTIPQPVAAGGLVFVDERLSQPEPDGDQARP